MIRSRCSLTNLAISRDFRGPKSTASLQPHRVEPEFRHVVVPLHMHVHRLSNLVGVEEKPVRALS